MQKIDRRSENITRKWLTFIFILSLSPPRVGGGLHVILPYKQRLFLIPIKFTNIY